MTISNREKDLLTALHDEVDKNRKDRFGGLPFSDFALCVIDTHCALVDANDFYAGKKQIDFYETPATRMISEHNLIAQLDLHRKNPINLIRAFRASGLDELALTFPLGSLLSTLHDLVFAKYESDYSANISELEGFLLQFRELSDEEFAEFKSTEDYNDFKEFLDNLALELKDLHTKLRLVEHDVYDAHPDWEVTFYESEDNPLDGREDRRNQSRARHAYFAKYGNPLRKFEAATRLLTFSYEEVKASINSINESYLPSFKELIAMPVTFAYESPVETVRTGGRESSVTDSLSPYLAEAKQRFLNALHAFFARRESELPNDCCERESLKTMAARVFNAHKDFEIEITGEVINRGRRLSVTHNKKTRRGTRHGVHGPQTQRMKKQLAEFKNFLIQNPINENESCGRIAARAKQFWNKNKKTFENAAKAKSGKNGYKSPEALASAYRTSKS